MSGCFENTSLTSLYYEGTVKEWNNVVIQSKAFPATLKEITCTDGSVVLNVTKNKLLY